MHGAELIADNKGSRRPACWPTPEAWIASIISASPLPPGEALLDQPAHRRGLFMSAGSKVAEAGQDLYLRCEPVQDAPVFAPSICFGHLLW